MGGGQSSTLLALTVPSRGTQGKGVLLSLLSPGCGKIYYPREQNLKGSYWIASLAPLASVHVTELPKYCFNRELDTEQNKEGVSLAWPGDTKPSFT